MTSASLSLILISVSFTVVAQLLLKLGMSTDAAKTSLNDGALAAFIYISTNAYILCGMIAYGMSMLLWLGVLSRVDVSRAYPFVGLGIIGTMILAYYFFSEPLTVPKIVGTILIVTGIVFVSK